jgi:hypothetical protein
MADKGKGPGRQTMADITRKAQSGSSVKPQPAEAAAPSSSGSASSSATVEQLQAESSRMKAERHALRTEAKASSFAEERLPGTSSQKPIVEQSATPVALSESASIAAMEPELLSVKDKRTLFEQQNTGAIAAGNNKPPREPRISKGPPVVEMLRSPSGGTYAEHLTQPPKPFVPVEIDPAKTLSGKGKVEIDMVKAIYQDGQHFNKHGRQMGYKSSKEYDKAAKDFAQRYQNHPDTILKEGHLNSKEKGKKGPVQRIVEYDGLTVIVNPENGQVINFYDGCKHSALIDIKRIK